MPAVWRGEVRAVPDSEGLHRQGNAREADRRLHGREARAADEAREVRSVTEPNGFECFDCGGVFDLEPGEAIEGNPCPTCDALTLGPVRISPCPKVQAAQASGGDFYDIKCDDEDHHHGRQDHVATVAR
jgi:hypothetical protein